MKPTSLSEVLHHLADGGVVSVNTSDANGGNTVEFRFVDGFESRLPDQEWFPCATTLQLRVEGCTLVDVANGGGLR